MSDNKGSEFKIDASQVTIDYVHDTLSLFYVSYSVLPVSKKDPFFFDCTVINKTILLSEHNNCVVDRVEINSETRDGFYLFIHLVLLIGCYYSKRCLSSRAPWTWISEHNGNIIRISQAHYIVVDFQTSVEQARVYPSHLPRCASLILVDVTSRNARKRWTHNNYRFKTYSFINTNGAPHER